MGNREEREYVKSLHLLLAFCRTKDGQKARCIRSVIKFGDIESLQILRAKLLILGGQWRVHKTVNARDVEKARKWLLKRLIDHPENAAFTDSEWRTALLQPGSIYGDKKFMLDIDTVDEARVKLIMDVVAKSDGVVLEMKRSPSGWHVITEPFDTRKVCALGEDNDDVSLIRDGYIYIETVCHRVGAGMRENG